MTKEYKYKVGDTFKATLVIQNVDEESDEIGLIIREVREYVGDIGVYLSSEELDEAFDPNYKERKLMQILKDTEEQLKQLRESKNE